MHHVRVSSHQSPVQKLGDTQMTLSPKFRLATSEPELLPGLGPLVPGLPDDVALNCLLRLPVDLHPTCRAVCRRWRHLLATKERFFTHRKALGLSDPWLLAVAYHPCSGRIQWQVLDLARLSWHAIPDMPCRDRVCPRGFGLVANMLDGTLLVCGGLVSDMDCPLHLVLKYEVHRNRWTVMKRMITPRSFFAGAMIGDRVYVAGGYSADQFELDSGEVLDPADGTWRPIASMGTNMSVYDSVVLGGKMYVTEGWVWPFLFSPRGQVYDPRTDSWEAMSVGMREGWTGLGAVIYGRLFVVSEHERMSLKVYDVVSDKWDSVEGSPIPEMIRKPFSVSSNGSRIYVIGRGLRVVVGNLQSDGGSKVRRRFSVRWEEDFVTPRGFRDLTPSGTAVLIA